MKKNILLIALLVMGFMSCNNETDEQGPLPTINNYVVENGHEEGDGHRVNEEETVIIMGEEAVIEADLAGSSLSTVQLDIHWGAGHEHRVNSNDETPKWTEKIVWKFGEEGGLTPEGVFPNSHKLHEHIDVPTGVAEGDYHFVLHLWDQKGNETQSALTIHVEAEGHEHEEGHDHE